MKKNIQSNFNKAKGFTLIELIIVIIILGILAVTAAPKFIDIQGDARASVMRGVQGSVNSAMQLGHAKALIAGTTSGDVTIAGQTVAVVFSYPTATSIALLVDAASISFATGTYTHPSATTAGSCKVVITSATSATVPPTVVLTDMGC